MSILRLHLLVGILFLVLSGCGGQETQAITIQASGMSFTPARVTVKIGQAVSLRIINRDGYAHAFDLDAFDIHSPLSAKETQNFSFTPETPGRFLFYCSSPGHKMAGMEGLLIVEP
jgi:plastocyanin